MRPLRLLLSLCTSLIAVSLLLYATLGSQQDEQLEQDSVAGKQGGFKALFSFTSPGSLFPPSAIISLTDDNSTFFLARPAAFGPTLPKDGLSSPLWIGSGFGDEAMGKGELGCSDSPGWDGRKLGSKSAAGYHKKGTPGAEIDGSTGGAAADTLRTFSPDDGTDEHLRLDLSDHNIPHPRKEQESTHADIQSLQESAEIKGKVVLLKRGGCGFMAKVLWAQKRGAVAVIVGDDVRGGPLIRMYAQGDTSNVAISSLFTSHTTAHLLSSLIPPGGHSQGPHQGNAAKSGGDQPDPLSKVGDETDETPISSHSAPVPSSIMKVPQHGKSATANPNDEQTWMAALLSAFGIGIGVETPPTADSRRPPSSGDLEWVQVGHVEDNQNTVKSILDMNRPATTRVADAFVIGKQDWRDPEVLHASTLTSQGIVLPTPAPATTKTSSSVLPGSGEYVHNVMTEGERKAWWAKWFGARDADAPPPSAKHASGRSVSSIADANLKKVKTTSNHRDHHEGLWVTLTPTNVSTSPFFDTLLVLVVSPLVTLTVVYALLLLRSRIRRRRWRAPKSLVERLPVRTYQTISDSSSSATPNASSPTTPLLQHSSPPPTSPIPASASPTEQDASAASSSVQHDSRTREEEKRETGLAEWRRRYGGRQRECVVCLEEYEDGVSQVMSLPCGHEFHADCM
jgi:hypothetical protein